MANQELVIETVEPADEMVISLPWITVVIPTYGEVGVDLTDQCLRSLRATHAHLTHIEIFVVSDGPDGYERLRGVCEKYNALPVLMAERRGFAAACNQGLARSNGQVVYLCNNDIEFIEPCLQIMTDLADKMNAGIISCRLLYPNMTIQHAGVFFAASEEAYRTLGVPGYWDHFRRGEQALDPGAVTLTNVLLSGALLGITQWAKQTVGLLDEGFGFTCEDIHYNLCVMEAGRMPVYCGYTAAIHHEGATRGATLEEKLKRAPDVVAKEAASLKRLFSMYPDLDWNMFAAGT